MHHKPLKLAQRHVVQGDYEVTDDPDIVLTTVLGSCVACCVHDTTLKIGGMNHFLLPDTVNDVSGSEHRRYGVHLMELLLNELYKRGARRETLEVKIFGGAHVVPGLSDIGAQNAEFAVGFLHSEELKHVGGHTGGDQARRVQFWPASGRARQKLVASETAPANTMKPVPVVPADVGDVELF